MAQFASLTTTDQAKIDGGDTRDIHFRPGEPGPIGINCTASSPRAHAESGFLARVDLLRPGTAAPVATVKVKSGSTGPILLGHNATAAELAAAGNWTVRVMNATDVTQTFTTRITCPSTFVLQQASFDIPLLNLILAQTLATAAIRIHLESSAGDAATVVSLNPTIAANLKMPGPEWRTNVPDFDYQLSLSDVAAAALIAALVPLVGVAVAKLIVDGGKIPLRIAGLDSDPAFPTVFFDANRMVAEATLRFDTSAARIEVLGWPLPDIKLDEFAITIDFGLDGSITPQCQTRATLPIPGFPIDLSDTVKGKVEDKIGSFLASDPKGPQLAPPVLKQDLAKFFGLLMRLADVPSLNPTQEAVAHIQRYGVQGQALVVDYYVEFVDKVIVATGGIVVRAA
jgi:hypothetical protein